MLIWFKRWLLTKTTEKGKHCINMWETLHWERFFFIFVLWKPEANFWHRCIGKWVNKGQKHEIFQPQPQGVPRRGWRLNHLVQTLWLWRLYFHGVVKNMSWHGGSPMVTYYAWRGVTASFFLHNTCYLHYTSFNFYVFNTLLVFFSSL